MHEGIADALAPAHERYAGTHRFTLEELHDLRFARKAAPGALTARPRRQSRLGSAPGLARAASTSVAVPPTPPPRAL